VCKRTHPARSLQYERIVRILITFARDGNLAKPIRVVHVGLALPLHIAVTIPHHSRLYLIVFAVESAIVTLYGDGCEVATGCATDTLDL
jgi:hypothetical protein